VVGSALAMSAATVRPEWTLCPVTHFDEDLDENVDEFFECPGPQGDQKCFMYIIGHMLLQ
jgi:hypothetical protein